MISQVPDEVRLVMDTLESKGYEAYIVGGAVRDLLRGQLAKDYDIATNAVPEEVVELARKTGWRVVDKLGRNFGVTLVVVQGLPLEIAAYRGECYGEDSHRPAEVWYTDKIEEDLARRDFTVNALALDRRNRLIDLFGGQQDLTAGVIRAVGVPSERFREDALRMFRACRFAAQLGFMLDEAVVQAIPEQLERTGGLSLERVREELEKTLLADYAEQGLDAMMKTGLLDAACRVKEQGEYRRLPIFPELQHLVGLSQDLRFHRLDGWRHTLATVQEVAKDRTLRWAALLHDIGKGLPEVRGISATGAISDYGHAEAGEVLATGILRRLQLPKEVQARVIWLVARHMRYYSCMQGNTQVAVRWLRAEARSGRFTDRVALGKAFCQLAELCQADCRASGHGDRNPAAVAVATFGHYLQTLIKEMPVRTAEVPYEADSLLAVLGDTATMGPFLKIALQRIQDGSLPNKQEAVTQAARRWISRYRA